MPAFNKDKTKVNLKLSISRLKLIQSKKTNLAKSLRKEIASLLENGKEESARIKVEHIIREDFLVEAYEILELFCDLLIARFGLIMNSEACDDAVREAVETIIWAAPRSDIKELSEVRNQFVNKYGKDFALACMENKSERVNPRVMHKLSVLTPEPNLVNLYLVEIAKAHNIDFDPEVSMSAPVVDLYGQGGSQDLLNLLDGFPGNSPGQNQGGLPPPMQPYDQPYQHQTHTQPPPAAYNGGQPAPAPVHPQMSAEEYQEFLKWQEYQRQTGGTGVVPRDGQNQVNVNNDAPPTFSSNPPPTHDPYAAFASLSAPPANAPSSNGSSNHSHGNTSDLPPAQPPPPVTSHSAALAPEQPRYSNPPPPAATAPPPVVSHPPGAIDDDLGLPSAPHSTPSKPPGNDDDEGDVPDFDDLAARFAALKKK